MLPIATTLNSRGIKGVNGLRTLLPFATAFDREGAQKWAQPKSMLRLPLPDLPSHPARKRRYGSNT